MMSMKKSKEKLQITWKQMKIEVWYTKIYGFKQK